MVRGVWPILVATSLALAGTAHALENPIAGEWTIEGQDQRGAYRGKATLRRTAENKVEGTLALERGQVHEDVALDAAWDGRTLTATRGAAGLAGRIAGRDGAARRVVYRLSDDATKLEPTEGARETLTRALGPTARIVILHTNDLHGQVFPLEDGNGRHGGLAALVARIRAERAAAVASGAAVLTLDGGDIYAGTPEGDETHGALMVDAMAAAGYDALTIGNHEFDQTARTVQTIVERAKFPVVSANLEDEASHALPRWRNLRGSVRLRAAGVDVCVVGLLTEALEQVTTAEGSRGVDAAKELATARRELATNADAQLFVLLTHIGQDQDVALATALARTPAGRRIGAIVGAHTHDAIARPKRVPDERTGALVAQAGKQGRYLGRIELVVDRATGAVKSASGRLIEVRPEDGEAEDVKRLVSEQAGAITERMNAVVGRLTGPLPKSGKGATPMGSVLCDAFRERARSDVAFYNKTGVRGELREGDVRRRDLYQVLPFGGPVVKLELTGKDLKAAVEGSLAPTIGTAPALEVSGLRVRFDSRRPAGQRAVAIEVNGQPLELERVYTVATSTFLAGGGDGHVAFNAGKNRTELEGTLLDALIAKFQGKTIDPPTREARWQDVAR